MSNNERLAEVIKFGWEASRISFETALRSPLPLMPQATENTPVQNQPLISENLILPFEPPA